MALSSALTETSEQGEMRRFSGLHGSGLDTVAEELLAIKRPRELEEQVSALELSPANALQLAGILTRRNAPEIAAEIYLDMLRSDPEQQDAYLPLAHRIHSSDAGQAELQLGVRLLESRPDDRAIRFSLARIYDRSGAPHSAFEMLGVHADLSTYPPYLELFTDLAARLGLHDQGRATAERLCAILARRLETSPEDSEARGALVRVRATYGIPPLPNETPDQAGTSELSQHIATAAEGMCRGLAGKDQTIFAQYVTMLSDLRPVTAHWPRVLDASRVAQLVDAGARATRAGWYSASSLLFQIVEETADFAVPGGRTQEFLVGAGHPFEAERWIMRSLACPTVLVGEMLLAYAELLIAQDRTQLATKIVGIACTYEGLDAERLKTLANVAQRKGLDQITIALLQKAVANVPLDRTARYALAVILRSKYGARDAFDMLEPTIAASVFPAAVALFLECAIVLDRMSVARAAMKQWDTLNATASAPLQDPIQTVVLAARSILHLHDGKQLPEGGPLHNLVAQLLGRSQHDLARSLCAALCKAGRLTHDFLQVAEDLLTIEQKIDILTKHSRDENRATVLRALARLHLERFDFAKCIACFRQASDLDPDVVADRELADVLALCGQQAPPATHDAQSAPRSLSEPGLWASFVARFDRLSDALPARGTLLHRPYPRRRLFDCCVLTNEIDSLEVRLAELSEVVDLFVIIEASLTFDFKSKPLNFEANRSRFSSYETKIRYIPVEAPLTGLGRYSLRTYMRNLAVASLHDIAHERDVVIVGDADEIPRISAIDDFLYRRQYGLTRLRLQTFKHFYNYRVVRSLDSMSAFIGRYSEWRDTKPAFGQTGPGAYFDDQYAHVIDDAGWAFLGIGSPSDALISMKEKSANMQVPRELSRDFSTIEEIERVRNALLRGCHTGTRAGAVEIDSTFPRLLRRQRQMFDSKILPLCSSRLSRLVGLMESDRSATADEAATDAAATISR